MAREDGGILARYAVVFEALAASDGGLSLSEIALAVSLPRGTVHRLIQSLLAVGYITPTGGRKVYVLGPRLLRLLHTGVAPASVSSLARPILEELVSAFGETAFLAKLMGQRVESIAMAVPDTPGQSHVQPGRVMPMHAAASAKIILAHQDEAMIGQLLEQPRTRFTKNTRVEETEVREDLIQVRRQGYAVCSDELDPGVLSYACPVNLKGAGVLYSVGLSGLAQRLERHPAEDVVQALKVAAHRLSENLQNGLSRPIVGQVSGNVG